MRWLSAAAMLVLTVGCEGESEQLRSRGPAGTESAPATRTGDDGTLVFNNSATGTGCEAANTTRGCECAAVSGRQVCGQNLVWGACECIDPAAVGGGGAGSGGGLSAGANDPPVNKGAARFEWLRTEPGSGGGDCSPGHYEGSLDGIYNAPSAFNAPVPIVSVDVTGAPGLQIDLESGGNGEFLVVSGGRFSGVALAIFPFEAEFGDGMLDCATGLFRARIINGTYIVFFDGFYGGSVMYEFEGEMVARYDAQTRSLVDGRWSVAEGGMTPPAIMAGQDPPIFPIGQAGGTGTWTAAWAR